MRPFFIIGFALLVIFDTVAQLGFKFAGEATAPATFTLQWVWSVICEKWSYLSVAGYIGAFITWMTLLKTAPIGPAFAASHLEVVTVLLVCVMWLGEKLSLIQIVGSLLIIGGIILFAVAEAEIDEPGSTSGEAESAKHLPPHIGPLS